MKRSDFIQSVTRTKVIETRLLSQEKIDRMIDADNVEDALKLLNETEYAGSFTDVSKPSDYDKILTNELIRVYRLMRDVSPYPIIVDLLALKYDYHNLKVMLKAKLYKKYLADLYIYAGITSCETIEMAYNEQDFSELPGEYESAVKEAWEDFEERQDPQRIDIIFDKHYFNHFYKMAKKTNIELFINYVKDLIDFTNVLSFIRLKKQKKAISFFEDVILNNGNIEKDKILSGYDDEIEDVVNRFKGSRISNCLIRGLDSYKETGRLSYLEKYMDDYLMDLNIPSKYINIGPEPIFSYILAKEAEIKTLRIVLVAKLNKLSPEVIRERVRDLYV